jgi:hypothetical protein
MTSGQVDWVGGLDASPFRDLPNMRATVAQTKAELCLQLGRLINKAPPADRIGSINKTREFVAARTACAKIAGNQRSSVPEPEGAINRMMRWHS